MKSGAQPGNTNNTKNKQWYQALDKVLAQEGGSKAEKYFKLVEIAEELVKMAKGGDIQAIKEIGDRLDGKSIQGISGPDGEPLAITILASDAGTA